MRRLAPHRHLLIVFAVVGVVTAFLTGWLVVGSLLAGVTEAALVAVALGVAFTLLAHLLASGPPSLDRSRSRAADATSSASVQSQRDCTEECDEG